jgi:uncharacterized protein (TIGR03067 family)
VRLLFLAVFAALFAVHGHASDQADGKRGLEALQGEWEVVEVNANGTDRTEELKKMGFKITFQGTTMRIPGKPGKSPEFTVTLDAAKEPKVIDMLPTNGPFKGQTLAGIYDLKGDELRLCMPNQPKEERPGSFFSDQGSGLGVFRMKRSAKAQPGGAKERDAAPPR